MISPDLVIWLQERTALEFFLQILSAIAQVIEEQVVPADQTWF